MFATVAGLSFFGGGINVARFGPFAALAFCIAIGHGWYLVRTALAPRVVTLQGLGLLCEDWIRARSQILLPSRGKCLPMPLGFLPQQLPQLG